MSWTKLYEDRSVRVIAPGLVHEWEQRILAAGRHYDDPKVLHGFTLHDLAEDLIKHRTLFSHNMALGKTRAAIASADVRGCKHTLFVIPNKLIGEWEKEFRFLGLGDQYQIITSLAQIDRYECPTCDKAVTGYRKVLDREGDLLDVKRECEVCGTKAVWRDNLSRFNLISMSLLWAVPSDSPHSGDPTKRKAMGTGAFGRPAEVIKPILKHTYSWYLRRRAENVMIDEAYSLGDATTLQTKAVNMLRPSRRTLITGTPVRGFPDQILPLLNWCLGNGSDLFPDFDSTQESSRNKFLKLFGMVVQRRREDGTPYEKKIPKIKNPDRFQAMLAPVMRRRVNLEPDVVRCVDMPDFTIFPIEVAADPLLEQLYNDCAKGFAEWYTSELEAARRRAKWNYKAVVSVSAITMLTKLNYLAHLAACPQSLVPAYGSQISSKQVRILNIIADAAARGRKVILFSEFVDSVEWYGANPALAHLNPVVITGTVSLSRSKRTGDSARSRRLEEFRKGDSGLLVATTRCVAEGFNIPEASVVIFDSYNWTPSIQNQAWSRVLRPAQTWSPVEIYLLGVRGTIDSFLSAQAAIKRMAIGEGIDYEEVDFEADDVPDPADYAKHIVDIPIVEGSSILTNAYNAETWLRTIKAKLAAAEKERAAKDGWAA